MKSASANNSMANEGGDVFDKSKRIEDSISSVISNVIPVPVSVDDISPQPASALFTNRIGANPIAALNSEFSTSIIPKHKSLASSLPSLTGIMVNSSLASISSNSPATASSLNISGISQTTTTSAPSSRQLQLVGDLPENVLETSCTPPASPSKGQNQHVSTPLPVFASLTPVNVESASTSSGTTDMLGLLSPTIETQNQLAASNSSFKPNQDAAGLTQLFPMASTASSGMAPMYLAVKIEPQEIIIDSASSGGEIPVASCSSSMLSPLQFSLPPGSILASPNLTTTVAGATGSDGAAASTGTSSGVTTGADLLSLQPAAVYVQPIQQNGQMQYLRLEMPSNVSFNGSGSTAAIGANKPSSVSTVELAHNIIATMFQQPINTQENNSVQVFESSDMHPSSAIKVRDDEELGVPAASMASTFVLRDQRDALPESTVAGFRITTSSRPANVVSRLQHQSLPAGIKVTTTSTPADPSAQQRAPAAPVASRKRASSSSASQSRNQSKDTPTSTSANIGSVSVEDEADDIYIDTKELCNRIAYELKAHSIPQAIFAERVLCRSQGTLSDLLRNPKPWNKLKSGRETFRRMYVWLKQPLAERLTALELWKGDKRKFGSVDEQEDEPADVAKLVDSSGAESPDEISSEDVSYRTGEDLLSPQSDDPVAASSTQQHSTPAGLGGALIEPASPQRHHQQQRLIKKPRLVFTDIQKRTLQAIFKETQRPSREMQQTIAEHLNLDLSTVQNFFMNARRRSRIDQPDNGGDSPTPFQQVRPITPPPGAGAAPTGGSTTKNARSKS